MATDIDFPHDALILDACRLINLLATTQITEILTCLPAQPTVARFVLDDEIIKLDEEPFRHGAEALQRAIDALLLQVVDFASEAERFRFIDLAGTYRLDDGEAMSAAIAIERNWMIASDDRRIHSVIPHLAPALRVLTTPEILKRWHDHANPESDLLIEVLTSIERYARYRPVRHHPLGGWWETMIRN